MDESNPTTQQPPVNLGAPKRKRRWKLPLIALIIVLFVGGVFAFMQMNEETEDYPEKLTGGTVTILDESFSPGTITIKKGESVTWVNESENAHQIASDPHPQHDTPSGLYSREQLKQGDTYTYTFTEAGTYTYHDELNPLYVKGTVVVE